MCIQTDFLVLCIMWGAIVHPDLSITHVGKKPVSLLMATKMLNIKY